MPLHDWTRTTDGVFHHFHHEWISRIGRSLNRGVLPKGYYALVEQRAMGLIPDVLGFERVGRSTTDDPPEPFPRPTSATALLTETVIESRPDISRRKRMLSIRRSGDDRLVAVIEIISPGNKASQRPLDDLAEKAEEFLNQKIHLLYLDLLPPGPRDPEGIHSVIWESMFGESDYRLPEGRNRTLVAYEVDGIIRAYVQPVGVGQALPKMPLFLAPGVPVLIPLEETYLEAWDDVPEVIREGIVRPNTMEIP